MMNDPKALVLFCLVFVSVFLALSALVGSGLEFKRRRVHSNTHEKLKDRVETADELLAKMRHDRGLTKDGYFNRFNYRVGKLVTQSGLNLRPHMVYLAMITLAVFLSAAGLIAGRSLITISSLFLLGTMLPLIILRFFVKRRQKKAARQLPEALDVIIRSLKAGHPVPVALSLAGRELPDPIGSEFGMASDELGFGGTVSTAIQRMADRIGQEDFDLFAAMIRLQEKTGGNLAELLEGNASTIRARQRLRLKIKASSAEGRASALILNAAPIGLYFVIQLLAPDFFGDVSDKPLLNYVFGGIIIWMLIGNLVIRKMINFKV